jgi:hypothetical protein
MEMNWNALPSDHPAPPIYGRVTEEQQARYAVEAYKRIQMEWPWVGVVNFWFFKRATEAERDQAWYYFRMVEPDFTPLPVYFAIKEYARKPPLMYLGYHQEDHWAVRYEGDWQKVESERAVLGAYLRSKGLGERISFAFHGTDLELVVVKGEDFGTLKVTVDDRSHVNIELYNPEPLYGVPVKIASGLPDKEHTVEIEVEGIVGIDGFIVR